MIRATEIGDVLHIVIDRADKANALTRQMLGDMAQAVEGAEAKLLVLTGEGQVFSAGADLDEVRHGSLATAPEWERLSAAIAAFPGLSVAALNGTVAGGAMGMVLACDLRLAVPTARFFYPVMRLGHRPQPSDPGRLVALVGPARARLILMAGQKIDAEEALRIGLIDRIETAPVDAALAIGADVLTARPEHIAAIKAMT